MDNRGYEPEISRFEVSYEGCEIPTLAEAQAECFLLDAEEYHSIQHKLDLRSLEIYRFMYSKVWKLVVFVSIVLLHCLAFLEYPSSLSFSSIVNKTGAHDSRVKVPAPLLYIFEAIFLIIICSDAIVQTYLFGTKKSLRSPWIAGFFIVMALSWIDFFINIGIGISYVIRIRRFFRPIFAMQKSQLMKKVLKSLSKTFVDIMSACFLLLLWLIGFTLLSVSIFSGFEKSDEFNEEYSSFYGAFFTLLVLLTTANNPDAMIKEYNHNRFSFLVFFIYMVVGIFVFMNVLIAIIFNEFRGHILDSMQSSLLRRRIACRAIFEVLKKTIGSSYVNYNKEIEADVLRRVIKNSPIPRWRRKEMLGIIDSIGNEVVDWDNLKVVLSPMDDLKESKKIYQIPKFDNDILTACQEFLLSKSFEIIGLLICLANVITIAVDVSYKSRNVSSMSKSLDVLNWVFICIYLLEQSAKITAMGYRIYFSRQACIVDFVVTVLILIMKIAESIIFHSEFLDRFYYLFGVTSVWDLPRVTNLLVMLRAVRIVLLLPSLTPIINTLFDIPWRLRSVLGLLVLLFYIYALAGMILFRKSITPTFMSQNVTDCGTYQQLNYGALNFNDFYSSLVVLWCLLIVNNWHVFMIAFAEANSNKWVHLYMISWWVLAVIVVLNCVTAFVIEGYTQRKAYFEEDRIKRMRPQSVANIVDGSLKYLRQSVVANNAFTFEMLFRNDLIEPNEDELLCELKRCEFLCEMYPHIAHSQYDS